MKYEVVLPGRPPGGVEVAARAMAEAFGIPQAKAAGLLRRAPGALTKGIDEREAVRVAYRLRKLGLAVEVRPVNAQPAAAAVGRAGRATGSAPGGGRPPGREASPTAEAAATSSAVRSPFLSQVDEAPPPIPGLDDGSPHAPSDRRHRDRRREAAADGIAPRNEPVQPSGAPRSDAPRSDVARSVPPKAESQPRPDRAAREHPAPEPEQAASGTAPTGDFGAGEAPTPAGSGSWRVPEPYRTGERSGERPAPVGDPVRVVRSPFGRHLLLAAVLPGFLGFAALTATWFLTPDRSIAMALVVGAVVLAIGATWMWLAGRPLLREHDRVLAETIRISRGDLARPVLASDRYPEAVQALERIRVSLQEGLDRLRRRKR